METQVNKVEPQSGKFPQGIIWIAGIALTLFCAVGIAAMMGWIPNSMGGPDVTAAVQPQPAKTPIPTPAPTAATAHKPSPTTARTAVVERDNQEESARVRQAERERDRQADRERDRQAERERDRQADRERVRQVERVPPVQVAAAAKCTECGVIESVREISAKGAGSGVGAVGGGVLGGLLGNQAGGGRGQDVMTVVGVVGGAVAGNEVEKRVKATKSYEIIVRMNDGSSRVISQANASNWRIGDKVRIVNGAIQSNS